jgi:FkbM family methyltransferase
MKGALLMEDRPSLLKATTVIDQSLDASEQGTFPEERQGVNNSCQTSQYRLANVAFFPAGDRQVLAYARDTEVKHLLQRPVANLLAQCQMFKTIDEHVDTYCREQQLSGTTLEAIRSKLQYQLQKLAQEGYLISSSQLFQAANEHVATTSSMIYEHGYNRIRHTRHGAMLYNINDQFIGRCLDLYGEWAWGEIECTAHYAKGIVLDVGANIGTHTLAYAKLAKQVIAFEPVIGLFTMLCTNLALNCIENVLPLNIAVGQKNGITSVSIPDYSVENNFGSCSVSVGNQQVHMDNIDHYNLSDVSMIKIDVEGYEQQVLEGAMETIARCKPALYVENDRIDRSDALCSFIESIGYSMQVHNVPLVSEHNYRGNKYNLFPGIYSLNMLCLPKDGKEW